MQDFLGAGNELNSLDAAASSKVFGASSIVICFTVSQELSDLQ